MTDVRPATEVVAGEENLHGEPSISQFVRFAALAVVSLNAVLAAIEFGRVALATASASHVGLALLAIGCVVPLHLRHVVYGLRGVRPQYGYWTLGALGLVNVAAVAVIGPVWLMNFALLGVSALILLPARWALPAFAVIVLSTGPLAGPPDEFSGSYLIFSVAWRSITLFVLVWLVAAYRQLDVARREFRDQAVVRDRVRIESELRRELGRALEGIVARSSRASALAEVDATSASNELRALVHDSRGALADARRLITRYQRASIRGELDTALALLDTAGVDADVVIATERSLDGMDERVGQAIRSAVIRALGDDTLERCVLVLAEDHRGEINVRLEPGQKPHMRLESARQ